MPDHVQIIQVLPNNDLIPMATSALGEVKAAETMDLYPNAGYHFFYAVMELNKLSPNQEEEIFS